MKLTYFTRILACGLLSALLLSSCSDDGENSLDDQLDQALATASGGAGREFFKQPYSHEFSKIPQDPKNPLTEQKVALGQLLFHETGIAASPRFAGASGTYSCASCHHAKAGFQAGVRQGVGEGGLGFGQNGEGRLHDLSRTDFDVQPIRTPSAMNGAYQKLQLWNGQFGATDANLGTEALWTAGTPKETNWLGFEGLETQAIAGLGVHRLTVDEEVLRANGYLELFDQAFAEVPENERYTNRMAGLAIAAYERTLLSNQAPFQQWLRGEALALSEAEKRGALLFFGKAECVSCHTGPALNSMRFEAIGMSDLGGDGTAVSDEDARNAGKGRGGFTGRDADMYRFKVPQLYNLMQSRFYGHGGDLHSIREVVEYKNAAVKLNQQLPDRFLSPEFHSLQLTEAEVADLVRFIENGLYDEQLERYVPLSLPSGNCFPNADAQSIVDLGCQ